MTENSNSLLEQAYLPARRASEDFNEAEDIQSEGTLKAVHISGRMGMIGRARPIELRASAMPGSSKYAIGRHARQGQDIEVLNADFDPDALVNLIISGGRSSAVDFWQRLEAELSPNVLGTIAGSIRSAIAAKLGSTFDKPFHEIGGGQPESFVERAQRLDSFGQTDAALDLIYDSIDELMRESLFSELDHVLSQVPVRRTSTDVLIGLLTATLPARTKLQNRGQLFRDVERELRERGEMEDNLLTGLEP